MLPVFGYMDPLGSTKVSAGLVIVEGPGLHPGHPRFLQSQGFRDW